MLDIPSGEFIVSDQKSVFGRLVKKMVVPTAPGDHVFLALEKMKHKKIGAHANNVNSFQG